MRARTFAVVMVVLFCSLIFTSGCTQKNVYNTYMSSYKNKSVENRQLSLLNLTNNSNNSKKINILYKVVKQNSSNLLKKQLRPPSEGHYNCTIN